MKSNILDDFKWIMLRGKLPLSVQIDSKDRPLSLMTVHFDALCVAQERLILIDRPLSDVHFGPESEKLSEQKDNIECTPRYLLEDSRLTFALIKFHYFS